jgi:hypothetical protein
LDTQPSASIDCDKDVPLAAPRRAFGLPPGP